METLTNKRRWRSDSPPAAGPRWLKLNSCIDDEGGDSSVADAKTTAASCNSSGKPFSISFGIAAPPACCSLHFDWLGAGTAIDSDGKHSKSHHRRRPRIIASHDDALLIEISVPSPEVRHGQPPAATFDDYFMYEAGGGARPPSLSLLPGFYVPVQKGYRNHSDPTPRFRYLHMENTGILRRGEDDLVVCQFEMTWDSPIYNTADLCMLHIGCDREWIVKRVPIVEHHEGSSELHPWRWTWRKSPRVEDAVPVGNRFLCWFNYNTDFILCDVADEETTKVRYVPLPATQHDDYCGHDSDEMRAYCTLGAADPNAVRFVNINPPRCCLGDIPGKTSCEGSSSSFNVTTWTLTLSTEEATTWVKVAVVNCNEIWKWRLPNYECLPRDKHLQYPMVSSDDPDVIYFKVEGMAVAINIRSKKLLSVIPSGGTRDETRMKSHLI